MTRTNTINEKLFDLPPISLQEMGTVKLMNRVDTKFVTTKDKLLPLLQLLQNNYRVQEINNTRISIYRTLYFDTEKKAMYLAHQNGKSTREKIRMREYVGSDLVFLEIKNKNNRGRTKKVRTQLPGWNEYRNEEAEEFLEKKAWYVLNDIIPHVQNTFDRITLVNKEKTERLTIDLSLRFNNLQSGGVYNLENLLIIELKQDGYRFSYARKCLRDLGIPPMGFSKYCIGSALTNPTLKQNNIKERIRNIQKMEATI